MFVICTDLLDNLGKNLSSITFLFYFEGSPKRKNNDSSLVMYEGNETTVHFEMIANPAPDRLMIYYIGSFLNDTLHKKLELENAAIFACKVNGIYMLTCIVTLYNKTAFDTGFYSAEFSNGLGNVSFDFRITVVQSLTTVPSMVPGMHFSLIVNKCNDYYLHTHTHAHTYI